MPMDAWREGDEFVAEFDLPGIDPKFLDPDIERNVVTVRAAHPELDSGREMIAAERSRGVFSRLLISVATPRRDQIPHTGSDHRVAAHPRVTFQSAARIGSACFDSGSAAVGPSLRRVPILAPAISEGLL